MTQQIMSAMDQQRKTDLEQLDDRIEWTRLQLDSLRRQRAELAGEPAQVDSFISQAEVDSLLLLDEELRAASAPAEVRFPTIADKLDAALRGKRMPVDDDQDPERWDGMG